VLPHGHHHCGSFAIVLYMYRVEMRSEYGSFCYNLNACFHQGVSRKAWNPGCVCGSWKHLVRTSHTWTTLIHCIARPFPPVSTPNIRPSWFSYALKVLPPPNSAALCPPVTITACMLAARFCLLALPASYLISTPTAPACRLHRRTR
jgi:hypothetical protein